MASQAAATAAQPTTKPPSTSPSQWTRPKRAFTKNRSQKFIPVVFSASTGNLALIQFCLKTARTNTPNRPALHQTHSVKISTAGHSIHRSQQQQQQQCQEKCQPLPCPHCLSTTTPGRSRHPGPLRQNFQNIVSPSWFCPHLLQALRYSCLEREPLELQLLLGKERFITFLQVCKSKFFLLL